MPKQLTSKPTRDREAVNTYHKAMLHIVDIVCTWGINDFELQEFLEKYQLNNGLIFIGKGTAESDIADIFGFGLSDKLITCVLVPEHSQEKMIKELTDVLGIEQDHFGLTMLLETSSASSAVMSMLGL